MDSHQRSRLIRQRAVAKAALTRMQNYIDADERKLHELQVRYDDLANIFNKFEFAQNELELSDEDDHSEDREVFEHQYYQVRARFMELLQPIAVSHLPSLPESPNNGSERGSNAGSTHSSNNHIKLPTIQIPTYHGDHCQWLNFKDTFESLIVQNTTLSNIQRFHYLVAALQGEAKALIANLPITNDNFKVAWDLITQRYNNVKLIAMKHVTQLCQMPQTKKGDATSLRQLINHIRSNVNALQALTLNVPMHTLILNHLLLSALDTDTHKTWEIHAAAQEDIPSTTEVIQFLENRCKALELLQTSQLTTVTTASSKHTSVSSGNKVSHTSRCHVATSLQCPLCKESHQVYHCPKFLKWSAQQRIEFAYKAKLCYNCLQQYSKGHVCSTQTCRRCNKRHHTSLHGANYGQAGDNKATSSKPVNNDNHSSEGGSYFSYKGRSTNHILLATAMVDVQTKTKNYVSCRVLLDSASQLNFISEQCVNRLGLTKHQSSTSIQGVNKVNTSTQHSVSIRLQSRHSEWQSTVKCAVLPHITDNIPSMKLNVSSWKLPTDLQLADEKFNEPGSIDILIGAELFYEMLLPDQRTRHGYPVLQKTVLGWTLSGITPHINTSTVKQNSFMVQDTTNLELNLQRFWEIEPVESTSMTTEQMACEQHFIENTIRQSDGRFIVRLPVKMEPTELGTSRRMAETRLCSLERRLDRDPELKTQYHNFMQEYEAAGHMKPVHPQLRPDSVCYYIPHHPVFKESSTTTKLRVVFDAGAKTSTGLSLNDILQVGPTVQQDLYSLVLRFRTYQNCFTADIAQMYRQVVMNPQDRNLQRILWRYSSDEPIQEYQLTTVTYGMTSSPFLATRCLKKLAEDNLTSHPRAAQVLLRDFYVDDLLSGATTLQEAIDIQQELSTLLNTAGFLLRKWASNNSSFMDTIPEELRETRQTLSLDNEDGVTTLGLQWNTKTDELQVRNNSSSVQSNYETSTKRTVLAVTASIFDPLGLLSPTVIMYKMFLQQLWLHKLDWDTQLPTSLREQWNQLLQTIPHLFHIKVPRKVICADAVTVQLHGFCDSSQAAYGACLYIRSTDSNNQTFCELLCSTSKVAPIKQLSIPRLELCAAVLLAKLFKRATRALALEGYDSYLWTDSTIVLTWIQGVSTRWKTFVGNRVAFIQGATTAAIWRHVPSSSNPADLISRGTDPTTMSASPLWWHGPGWLLHNSSTWPVRDFKPATEDLEIKKTLVAVTTSRENITERFSKLLRLTRVMAYCRRFIHNCRQAKPNRKTTPLTAQELDSALISCIKLVQQIAYAQEIEDLSTLQEVSRKSSLKSLHPFLDQQGVIRVGGRLQQSTLPYHAIHQVILPSNNHLTKLIVASEHIRLHHAGPQLLIASLRERYWIIKIRNVVKTIIHQCLICYRHKAQASQQLMSELPATRVRPARPFLTTGIDYAGPVYIRLGPPRSKQTSKGYIAIFVCFATKAVHIELVTSLSTDSFLAALRRFTARRGKPRTIYSDNGTNFQGAANQLHDLYSMLQSPGQMAAIHDHVASEGCTWHFIPPQAPHHGGLWEAAVKSMKHHLKRTLGSTIATYEELCTLLTEIEACLNSRPICALSSDPHSSTYLSPGHFLIGDPLVQLPTADLTNVKSNRLTRWQQYQQQLQLFWKSWSADYLNDLQQRQRWQRSTPNLRPKDVVLLKDDNTAPLQWPTAVIMDTFPGPDGNIRVVTVKTSKGIFKRPISKICPLPHVNSAS